MTHKVVLGYLAKKFNKELENRQALFGNGRIEDLIGKQIHQAMPVYEEDYPGTGDGIALTFTDGTYVFFFLQTFRRKYAQLCISTASRT